MKRMTILHAAVGCLATPCVAGQPAPPPAAACPAFSVASKFTDKTIVVNITPVIAGAVYGWTVNTGTIKAGQGTPSLTIDTAGLPKKLDVEVSDRNSIPVSSPSSTPPGSGRRGSSSSPGGSTRTAARP